MHTTKSNSRDPENHTLGALLAVVFSSVSTTTYLALMCSGFGAIISGTLRGPRVRRANDGRIIPGKNTGSV